MGPTSRDDQYSSNRVVVGEEKKEHGCREVA